MCPELLKLAVTHSLGQPIPILYISKLIPNRYTLIYEKLEKKMLWYGKIYNSCHFLFMRCRLLDDISVVLTNHLNTKESFTLLQYVSIMGSHSPPQERYATKGQEPNPTHHHSKEAGSNLERLEKTIPIL